MALNVPLNTEQDALLSLLSNCYPWKTCTKFKPRLWADVNKADKPALFLVFRKERDENRGRNLIRVTRTYEAWIYVNVDASESTSNPVANTIGDILDGIRNGMQRLNPDGSTKYPGPGESQTLSWPLGTFASYPLVIEARIEGDIIINPGITDPQHVIISVPILTLTGSP